MWWTLCLTAALVGLLLSAGSASAHSALLSSSPADGARLSEAPASLVLTFNETIQPEFSKIALTGPAGAVATEEPAAKAATLTTALPELPAGAYRAAYRVVSADGHPISGVISFTVLGAPASPSTSPSPSPSSPSSSAPGTPSATATPTPSTTASPSASTAPSAAPAGESTDGSSRLIQLVGLILVAGLAWFTLGRLRGRTRHEDHG